MKVVKQSATLWAITVRAEDLIEQVRTKYSQDESVLEHASATFQVTCTRKTVREFARHRVALAVANRKGFDVIEPPGLTEREEWVESCYVNERAKFHPECSAVRMVITADMRQWLYVVRAKNVSSESLFLRKIILGELLTHCPRIFGDVSWK